MERPTITAEIHAQVAMLAARAGLELDEGEIDAIAVPFTLAQTDLRKLHEHAFGDGEPSVRFDPRFVAKP